MTARQFWGFVTLCCLITTVISFLAGRYDKATFWLVVAFYTRSIGSDT